MLSLKVDLSPENSTQTLVVMLVIFCKSGGMICNQWDYLVLFISKRHFKDIKGPRTFKMFLKLLPPTGTQGQPSGS